MANGASSIAGDLAAMLEGTRMEHVQGAPNHRQTQGKIERGHQTLKTRIPLENHDLPGARRPGQATLEARIKEMCETRVRYGLRRVHVQLRRDG